MTMIAMIMILKLDEVDGGSNLTTNSHNSLIFPCVDHIPFKGVYMWHLMFLLHPYISIWRRFHENSISGFASFQHFPNVHLQCKMLIYYTVFIQSHIATQLLQIQTERNACNCNIAIYSNLNVALCNMFNREQ